MLWKTFLRFIILAAKTFAQNETSYCILHFVWFLMFCRFQYFICNFWQTLDPNDILQKCSLKTSSIFEVRLVLVALERRATNAYKRFKNDDTWSSLSMFGGKCCKEEISSIPNILGMLYSLWLILSNRLWPMLYIFYITLWKRQKSE